MVNILASIKKMIVFILLLSFLPLLQAQAISEYCPMDECTSQITMQMNHNQAQSDGHHDQANHDSHCNLCYFLSTYSYYFEQNILLVKMGYYKLSYSSYHQPLITPPPNL
ncbi:MAG: hypothetical protein ACK5MJ_08725 [Alphaproteobacteria bacterium]